MLQLLFFLLVQPAYSKVVFQASSSLHFTNSNADKVENATYQQKFTNIFPISVGLGLSFWDYLYLGSRYEYWFGTRKMSVNNETFDDKLKIQTLGFELGVFKRTPRTFVLWSLGVHYPLVSEITSNALSYKAQERYLLSQLRIQLGVKLAKTYAFFLEAGYRYFYLGRLKANDADYLPEGSHSLNFSGPFIGMGFLFEW